MTAIQLSRGDDAAVSEYLSKPYARRLTPDEDGGFVATIQEFPGCIAEGDSADEALKSLERAASSWIVAQLAANQSIPEPISLHGYSGKLALRIPRGLHKRVAELASTEGVSINQFLTCAISSFVGAKSLADRLLEEVRSISEREGSTFYVGRERWHHIAISQRSESTDERVLFHSGPLRKISVHGNEFKRLTSTSDFHG